jgi:hypothetical protein
MRQSVFVTFLVVLSACGDSAQSSFASKGQDVSTSAPPGPTSSGGTNSFGAATAPPKVDANGCSDGARLAYVVSFEGDLYSFAPADKKFTKIGPLNCGPGVVPVAMGVDRNAIAWVNGRTDPMSPGGRLYKVDTRDAHCSETKLADEWGGMGFATKPGSPLEETLFVRTTSQLKRVDFAAEVLMPVGNFPNDTADTELTGTGDGRLFGFLVSSPPALAPIDQTTAAVGERVDLSSVPTSSGPLFAFSFWGGDFYFYTATDASAEHSSTVSRYRPADGSIDAAYMTNIGFHIVGAGVSTCAPTTQPK